MPPFKCLVDSWKMKEEAPKFAVLEKQIKVSKDHGTGVDKLVSMAHEYYEDCNNKFKKVGRCKLNPC